MTKQIDFRVQKFFADKNETKVLEGSVEDLEKSDFSVINPITPNDGLLVWVSENIRPWEMARHLIFSSYELPNEDLPLVAGWPDLFEMEYDLSRGQTYRLGILTQGSSKWQIVGLPSGEEIVTLLQDPEDYYSASTRYLAAREIAEYAFHSDGPGPVSWDGSSVILEVDGWWIEAHDGDISVHDSISPKPNDPCQVIFDWLETRDLLSLYVIKYARLRDVNLEEADPIGDALFELEEYLTLRIFIDPAESRCLIERISAESEGYARLVAQVQDRAGRYDAAILELVQETLEDPSTGKLGLGEALAEELELRKNTSQNFDLLTIESKIEEIGLGYDAGNIEPFGGSWKYMRWNEQEDGGEYEERILQAPLQIALIEAWLLTDPDGQPEIFISGTLSKAELKWWLAPIVQKWGEVETYLNGDFIV